MGRRYYDSVEICGQLVRGTGAAILQLLAKSDKPLTVQEIGDSLPEALEDSQLFAHMRRLDVSGELVKATLVESTLRGHTQKRAAWEVTPAVKEFFSQQAVAQ